MISSEFSETGVLLLRKHKLAKEKTTGYEVHVDVLYGCVKPVQFGVQQAGLIPVSEGFDSLGLRFI